MPLSRRDLLKVSSVAVVGAAGCYTRTDTQSIAIPGADTDTMENAHQADTIAEQIHVAPTPGELPERPPLTPAIGITNEGRFMWSEDVENWIGPVGMGSEEHPADPSHFESVSTDVLNTIPYPSDGGELLNKARDVSNIHVILKPDTTYELDPSGVGDEESILSLHDNVIIEGDRSSVLKPQDGFGNVSVIGTNGDQTRSGILLRGFTIDGNRGNAGAGAGSASDGIDFVDVQESAVRGVKAQNVFADAFDLDACEDVTIDYCVSDTAGWSGFYATSGSKNITFRGCRNIDSNARDAFANATPRKGGLTARFSDDVYFIGCRSTGDGKDDNDDRFGIRVGDGASNITYRGCTIAEQAYVKDNNDTYAVTFDDCTFTYADLDDSDGPKVIESIGPDTTIRNVTIEDAYEAIRVTGDDSVIENTVVEDCVTHAFFIDGDNVAIRDSRGQGGNSRGVWVRGSDCVIERLTVRSWGGTEVDVNSGVTDTRLDDLNLPSDASVSDAGTRTRWADIIGGGPLGGVDIGSTTGAQEGDEARADGTTGDADAHYVLKANGDWQAVHDPTTTITPS